MKKRLKKGKTEKMGLLQVTFPWDLGQDWWVVVSNFSIWRKPFHLQLPQKKDKKRPSYEKVSS